MIISCKNDTKKKYNCSRAVNNYPWTIYEYF